MRRAWLRRFAVVTVALAAPAFAFVTFERLIRREGGPVPTPTLVDAYHSARVRVDESLRSAGERLRPLDGAVTLAAGERAAAPAPAPVPQSHPTEFAIPVLVYHNIRESTGAPATRPYDVTPAELDAHLAHLQAEGFTPVTVSAVIDAFAGAPLPAKPVVITFDDGRADQYERAAPLLKKRGFVATFFVFTNAIDRPGYMTWAQLKELVVGGHEVGSHAVYHPYLTKLDDGELGEELGLSKAVLEEGLGRPVRAFAYPFGLADERVVAATRAAGYDSARGLAHERVIRNDAALDLPGFIVTGSADAFRGLVDGP